MCGGRAGVIPASKQKAALGVLNAEVRACNSCCKTCVLGAGQVGHRRPAPILPPSFPGSGTQTLLEKARAELGEAQAKLIEQESALKELSDRGESWTLPRPLIPHPGCHSTLDSHTNTYSEEGYRDPIL